MHDQEWEIETEITRPEFYCNMAGGTCQLDSTLEKNEFPNLVYLYFF